MTRKRAGLVALFGVALLALAVEPAAAQTSDSATESLIWGLNMNLLYVAIPITVLVEGILIYTVWRFRNQEDPLPTQENRRLEVTWTIATAIILLFVGVASYQVMASPYVTAEAGDQAAMQEQKTAHVVAEAQRYGWTFYYNGSSWEGEAQATTTTNLKIPANQDVAIRVTSKDWLHAFHVPGLGLKSDAFPGQYNRLRTNVSNTGTYQLYCAEYCGSGHSQMLGTVEVVPQDEYESWLAKQQSSGEGSGNSTEA